MEDQLLRDATMRKHFVNPKTGKIYKLGEQITTRKNLVRTLKQLAQAEDPTELFYRSNMTKAMVQEFRENGKKLIFKNFQKINQILIFKNRKNSIKIIQVEF